MSKNDIMLLGAKRPRSPAFSHELDKFKNQQHSLRLSASNVAAMAGFHPWKILPELLMDLVYQGQLGQMLLQHDAQLLGLTLQSQEQMLRELAKRAGEETTQALEEALEIKTGSKKIPSVNAAKEFKQKVVEAARKSSVLSMDEIRFLQQGSREAIDTGYGTSNEDNALDLYGKLIGWEVEERNAEVRVWSFVRSEHAASSSDGIKTAVPLFEAVAYIKSQSTFRTEDISNNIDGITASPGNTFPCTEPFFRILGSVDGIRDELYSLSDFSHSNEDVYLRRVIVECKHRMNKIYETPPLYEQIQATVYCLMYNTSEADIVQVLRLENSEELCSTPSQQPNESTRSTESSHEDFKEIKISPGRTSSDSNEQVEPKRSVIVAVDAKSPENKSDKGMLKSLSPPIVTVSRVSLDDPVMQHRKNWTSVILPRLRQFVDMVYSVRNDDDKRYRLLMSVTDPKMEIAWKLVHEECPWLEQCDTAYSRKYDNG